MKQDDEDPRKQQNKKKDDDRKPPAKEIVCGDVSSSSPSNSKGNSSKQQTPHGGSADTSLASTVTENTAHHAIDTTITPRPALTAATPATTTALATPHTKHVDNTRPLPEVSRHWLQRELELLLGTAVLSLVTLIYMILPGTALLALAVWMLSSTALCYTLYQYALIYWQQLQHTGLLNYLPASMRPLWTETTLHEYMTDPTFGLEYRHLLLYFLPGLTAEQLQDYVNRLAPHHRAVLLQPGLGNLFGPAFMRLLIGDGQPPPQPPLDARAATTPTAAAAAAIPETPPTLSHQRRLYDDDSSASSDLGLEISANDLAGGLTHRQAVATALHVGIDRSNENHETPIAPPVSTPVQQQGQDATTQRETEEQEQELQEEYDQEGVVLEEAFWTSYQASIWSPLMQYLWDLTVTTVRPVTRPVLSTSLVVTLGSGGLVLWGTYWQGLFRPPSLHWELPSSSRSLWMTAMWGGATAGLMFSLRWYLRPSDGQLDDDDTAKKVEPTKDDKGEES